MDELGMGELVGMGELETGIDETPRDGASVRPIPGDPTGVNL
jgi:hypothetical protein